MISTALRLLVGVLICVGALALATRAARPKAPGPDMRMASQHCSAGLVQAMQGTNSATTACGLAGDRR